MPGSADTLTSQPAAPLTLHGSPSPKQTAASVDNGGEPASNNVNPKPRGSDASLLSDADAGTATSKAIADADGNVPDITSPHELMVFVEDVLGKLETNFDAVSNQVLERLEAISKKIDTVEQNISDLMQGNMSLEQGPASTSASSAASPSHASGADGAGSSEK